jgi:outer membrane protein assembly factor BamB
MTTLFSARHLLVVVTAATCLAGAVSGAGKRDPGTIPSWPQFRGPNGSAVSKDEGKLPVKFGSSANVVWKLPLPPGHSSPCIHDDRIFLTGFTRESNKLETFCLDRMTGKILWQRTAPTKTIERVHSISNPAVPTPVTDGKRIYVYFGSFGLLCYDFSGTEVWQKPLPALDAPFGSGPSPIVIDNKLVMTLLAGHAGMASTGRGPPPLLVIDTATGKVIWQKSRLKYGIGYAVPLARRARDHSEIVIAGSSGVMAYDLKDGRECWWTGSIFAEAIPSPALGDGLVYVVAQVPGGDPDDRFKMPPFDELIKKYDKNKDGMLSLEEVGGLVIFSRGGKTSESDIRLRDVWSVLDKGGSGKIGRLQWAAATLLSATLQNALLAIQPAEKGAAKVVWRERRGLPEIPSPLYYRGNVYLVKNGGILTGLDGKTGKLLYRKRLEAGGHYYASPVAGDGKIYTASQDGVVVVLKAGADFEILARNDLGETIMATPALAGGRIYLRTERHLYAFGEPRP